MAITCPIRKEEPKPVLGRVRKTTGPVILPTYVVGAIEYEQRINGVMKEVAAAYDRYQAALLKLRAIGGTLPDPAVDARQIRFPFADRYVSERYDIVQPNPALYGPWSSRLTPDDLKMAERPKVIPKITPPECRACLLQLAPDPIHRPQRTTDPDKRMAEIFSEIHGA
jgi:hypothetical protein